MKRTRMFISAVCILLALTMTMLIPTEAMAKTKKKKQVDITQLSPEEQLALYYQTLAQQQADAAAAQAAAQAAALAAQQQAQAAALAAQQQALIEAQKAKEKALADMQKTLMKGAQASTLGVVMIGDSRTVQMHEAVGDTGVCFIAENSKGYDWFVETGLPKADPCVGNGSRVVINLGVNDPEHIDKYISTMTNWAAQWTARGAKVYFATVNPVWENPYTAQYEVDNFNNKLRKGIPNVKIIDTALFLQQTGFRLVDGMHFDTPTTTKIYLYTMSNL